VDTVVGKLAQLKVKSVADNIDTSVSVVISKVSLKIVVDGTGVKPVIKDNIG
jgi:hypothetical protein